MFKLMKHTGRENYGILNYSHSLPITMTFIFKNGATGQFLSFTEDTNPIANSNQKMKSCIPASLFPICVIDSQKDLNLAIRYLIQNSYCMMSVHWIENSVRF